MKRLEPMSRLRRFRSLSPLSSSSPPPQTSSCQQQQTTTTTNAAVLLSSEDRGRSRKRDNVKGRLASKSQIKAGEDSSRKAAHDERFESSELLKFENAINIDDLLMPQKEICFSKFEGIILKHTAAKKLHQVLSGKSRPRSRSRTSASKENEGCKLYRKFIMEGPVLFTMGLQSQERYLFLYHDFLIISKIRSYSIYKLKNCIRLCMVWLSDNSEDVSELSSKSSTSFVLGWPTTNVVANFCSIEMKNFWLSKLKQLTTEARSKKPKTITIPIYVPWIGNAKARWLHISVTCDESARSCICKALKLLDLKHNDPSSYRLWVKSSHEDVPYSLIGHEYPYAIKMNHLWQLKNFDEKSKRSCIFILRSNRESAAKPSIKGGSRKAKKNELVDKMFKRSSSKSDILDMEGCDVSRGLLFGHSLTSLCHNDAIPKPIMDILSQLILKGPFTHGIFRKSANSKACQDLKNQLDHYQDCQLETVNTLVLASVFKCFLRSLPNCLLACEFYDSWLDASRTHLHNLKMKKVMKLLEKLPKPNLILLKHFLCVLWHIAQRSAENQMSASNLAVCIGPSLLWSSTATIVRPETSKLIPPIVEFLIEKCMQLFGKEVVNLFGNSVQREVMRQDSGAEETDSINSSTSGFRQDDSSLDSLNNPAVANDTALPSHNKLSLSNLSRDSGLTLSDSQLYSPEEEGEKASSSNSDRSSCNVPYFKGHKRPVITEKMQKGISCERISAHELVKAQEKQILVRSKSAHLSGLAYQDHDILSTTISGGLPDEQMCSNFCFRKDAHKRRLSRTRRWYNPCTPWDPDNISPMSTLKKSASEESKLNEVHFDRKLLDAQYQQLLRNPQVTFKNSAISSIIEPWQHLLSCRSKSLHQLPTNNEPCSDNTFLNSYFNNEITWHRTQSTPHLDEGSCDSSTVSDDDSTPHVSRSNSRGKEYTQFEKTQQYYKKCCLKSDSQTNCWNDDNCRSASKMPPGYEETITRQSFLRHNILPAFEEPLYVNLPELNLSKRALCLSTENILSLGDEMHYATPASVQTHDTEPPPLPPKPARNSRLFRLSSEGNVPLERTKRAEKVSSVAHRGVRNECDRYLVTTGTQAQYVTHVQRSLSVHRKFKSMDELHQCNDEGEKVADTATCSLMLNNSKPSSQVGCNDSQFTYHKNFNVHCSEYVYPQRTEGDMYISPSTSSLSTSYHSTPVNMTSFIATYNEESYV